MRNIRWINMLVVLLAAACADADPARPGVEIAEIRVTPPQATLAIGDTLELAAKVVDTEGEEVGGQALEWDVADESVAYVVPAGSRARLVGRAAGTVTVEVKTGTLTAAVLVTVQNPAPQVSALFPMGVAAGAPAFQLHVRGSAFVPGARVLWNGEERPTTYVSETELVAQIGAQDVGDVGTAEIRASNPLPGGGPSPERQVFTIAPVQVTSLTLQPAALTLAAGTSGMLAAEPRDAQGNVVVGRTVQWQSSNPAVATVGAQGSVSALAIGAAVITAAVDGVAAAATVTVTAAGAGSPVITSLTPDSAVAGAAPVSFVVRGQNFAPNAGAFIGASGQPTERVSATELQVTLWPETALASGDLEVRVYNPGVGGGWSNPMTFRLLPRLTSVVTEAAQSILFPNEGVQVVAHARDEQGRDLPGRTFAFHSTNPAVATVSAEGWVTAVGPGVAAIEVSTGGVQGSQLVRVFALPQYELLYETRIAGQPELALADADGSNRRRLMPGRWASDPAVSADGARIAFVGIDSAGNRDIYTVKRDGSELTRLTTDPDSDDQPAWSPDGTKLTWRNAGAWHSDIWVMNADGSGKVNLFDNFVRIGIPVGAQPTFTPDGGSVAFSYGDRAFSPFRAGIFVRPLDSAFGRYLTDAALAGVDTEPSYASAGNLVALRRTVGNFGDNITFVNAQTGLENIQLHPIGPGATPVFSPDGTWVSFAYADGTSTLKNVYLTMPGWGFRKRVLVNGENAVWLPK